ncbi:MAG TPA: pilus assembly protein TadG-related protein [Bryobacteraceae bacterium]|nr:pilus assembly protein TadG-related protein [Bryobacteraceae bacterium]
MTQLSQSSGRRADSRKRGQALVLVAFAMFIFLGFAGLAIDFGKTYVAYRQLQTSADAAALAGAQNLPNTTAASVATSFSGVAGAKNAYPNLPNVTMVSGYPLVKCSSILQAAPWNLACITPASANEVVVKQQVTVPLYFASLFGTPRVTLTATASAAMRGSSRTPYNVALVLDATGSMSGSDSDADCSSSRVVCAMQGIQVFLSDLSPCAASQTSCGAATSGNVANAVDRVALYVFPSVSTSTAADDYTCKGTASPTPYTVPTLPSSSTYQIVNFSSDYRTSDTASVLNTSSHLVGAAGTTKSGGCVKATGGEGTYYAQVIYQATNDLLATQAANPGTQNVMIILGDGDVGSNVTASTLVASSGTKLHTDGSYPSLKNQCHQAIAAGVAATHSTPPITVYTVAYGAGTSGCTTDSPAITPCNTMAGMASNVSQTFFSDVSKTSTGCPAGRPTSSLNQIFTEIAGDLTVSRLIPNGL